MSKLYNASNIALGLPHGAGTIDPDSAHEVQNPRVLEHPVVVNWIRAGKLQLLGNEQLPQLPERDTGGGDDGGGEQGKEFLSILDQSIPAIVEALPDLTDDQYDEVVRVEKANLARRGLVSEGAAFDREWERRYGADD